MRLHFEVVSKFNKRIRITEAHWEFLIAWKHPSSDQGRRETIARVKEIKVIYDKEGNTLNVWFDDPKQEHTCEETGDEVILVKDKRGKVIGFEKLNFLPKGAGMSRKPIPVKAMVA